MSREWKLYWSCWAPIVVGLLILFVISLFMSCTTPNREIVQTSNVDYPEPEPKIKIIKKTVIRTVITGSHRDSKHILLSDGSRETVDLSDYEFFLEEGDTLIFKECLPYYSEKYEGYVLKKDR